MIARRAAARRGGATTVEVAVVISVFLLFLFGMFEYCRFIFCLHVTTNACRDAARYAVVNVDKPGTFDDTCYLDPANTKYASIIQYCRDRMGNMDKMVVANPSGTPPTTATSYTYFTGSGTATAVATSICQIEVFPCDPALLNPVQPAPPAAPVPPTVAPKPGFTSWNQASFGERIAVRVSGEYNPVLPNFLMLNSTIPIRIVVTMGSEG